ALFQASEELAEADFAVGVGVAEDFLAVGRGVVVGQHTVPPVLGHGQVAAHGAQVAAGGHRGVVDVLRVGSLAVAAGPHAPAVPGGRGELHGADGVVPRGVAVQRAL